MAARVKAVGADAILFERYCVFTDTWKPETLEPINMTERGDYMLYRAAFLTEDECPQLATWKEKVKISARVGESVLLSLKCCALIHFV